MAIKHIGTYYENYRTKTFTEFVNGVITVYQESDIDGNVTYLSYPLENEWYKWEHNKQGDVIYHEDNTGYWVKKRFNEKGYPTYHQSSDDGITLDIENGIGTPNPTYKPSPSYKSQDDYYHGKTIIAI